MKKSGNPGPRQCYGFSGFPGGNQGGYYYSGAMGAGMGGLGGEFGGGVSWGGGGVGWGNTGGGWGNSGWMNGGGSPIVLGGGGGSGLAGGGMQQSGNSANYIDVNIPLKQVFSQQTRNNQRRRFRPARRAYRPVPISIINYNPASAASSSALRSAGLASARSSRSTGRPNPPPPTPTTSRRPVPPTVARMSGALPRRRARRGR